MNTAINKKIGKATAWSTATEILSKLISPIVNIILARLLLPKEFGIVATINMVISFAEIFSDAGFQKYLIQHEFASKEDLDNSTNVAFWSNLSFSAFIWLIIFIFRHKIATLVGNPYLGNSISIGAIVIVLAGFSSIQTARFKRDFAFNKLFSVRMIGCCIPLLVTVPLAFILKNYWALLIGAFASSMFNAIILSIKSSWKPKFYFRFSLFKEMLSFSVWTLIESISIWVTANVGIFVVGHYLNEYYLGLYKTGMTTISSYMALVSAAVFPVLFSALSRCQDDERQFQNVFYKVQKYLSILIIPMGTGIFLYRDFVTQILLGAQWAEVSDFIGMWGLSNAVVTVFSVPVSEVYRSTGKPRISFFVQVGYLCFLVPALILSVKHGFNSLTIWQSIIPLTLTIINIICLRVIYRFKVSMIIKNVLPSCVSTVIMVALALVLQLISKHFIWQLFSILLCVVIYFSAIFLLFPNTRKEILGLEIFQKIKNKMRKRTKSQKEEDKSID